MQVGSGGSCNSGWGKVPLGCSIQSGAGNDWAAHYKTSGDTGASCIGTNYQLVCKYTGKILGIL